MSDHERIGPLLQSHERAWTLKATEHEEAAERARNKKKAELEAHQNAPEEARRKMVATHDATINHHDKQARVHRRRAEHARAGYILHGPDETADASYVRDHQDLIDTARRAGRLRHTEESID
jgi:hypothetical protein